MDVASLETKVLILSFFQLVSEGVGVRDFLILGFVLLRFESDFFLTGTSFSVFTFFIDVWPTEECKRHLMRYLSIFLLRLS